MSRPRWSRATLSHAQPDGRGRRGPTPCRRAVGGDERGPERRRLDRPAPDPVIGAPGYGGERVAGHHTATANGHVAREADDELIARSRIYVDHRRGCIERAGDLCIPLRLGHLKAEQIAGEIGSLFAGAPQPLPGREDVTVFKSIGIIAQDLALAELIVSRAAHDGIGVEFDPGTGLCKPANGSLTMANAGALAEGMS